MGSGWVGRVRGVRAVRPAPGRWTAGLVALVGVLASLPSLVQPTWQQIVGDRQRGELLSGQKQWSWGRVELTGITGVQLSTVPNPVGLVVAVLVALLAAVAVVAWIFGQGALAIGGIALLAGRLLTTSAERHGRIFRDQPGSEAGLSVTSSTTTAGWLETAAVVALVVALVLMARLLVADSAPPVPVPAEADGSQDGEGAGAGEGAGRHTGAGTDRSGLRASGAHLDGPEVGLRDDNGE